ncbi:low molecular weight phosphatase family protein [Litorihabitans aurantiacus]|uniref:Low molecular weight phosphatase family protein n=1 Tax=Litorihabitans aurantiacus TaxID=1930061 RepID=A0AA37UUB7_9MICO|nr:low molecular weight phosphatase family protein [Litorihabitans aurantiacus]GMA30381.1 low molecular weight phosphatase family protein [Litorihabitans aurantiacus]
MTDADPTAQPVRILTICTGNICRSPAAERLLRTHLDGVEVTSAGTGALVGEPIHPPMAALMTRAGIDADGFTARALASEHVRDADLVLALTVSHRSQAVVAWPGALRRTFTLRELARLAEHVGSDVLGEGTTADRLRALVPLAIRARGVVRVPPEDDDVVDPYRRPDAVYTQAYATIEDAVRRLAAVVTP